MTHKMIAEDQTELVLWLGVDKHSIMVLLRPEEGYEGCRAFEKRGRG